MTITTQTADWEFTASGTVGPFGINDPMPDAARIAVVVFDPATGLITSPAHTVAANADFSGGTITFDAAVTSGLKVRAWRTIDGKQGQALSTFGPFPAKTIERMHDLAAADRLAARRFQQRALRAPDDEAAIDALPRIVNRKGKLMAFDASTGQPVVSVTTLASLEALAGSLDLLDLLPAPASAGSYVNVNGAGDAYQLRTPAQVTTDITYLQAGSGASARAVQSRLRDQVFATDFSAAAAGIVAALAAHTGVLVPPGTYPAGSARTVPAGKVLHLMPGATLTAGGGSWALDPGAGVISYTEGAAGDVWYQGRKITGTKAVGAGAFGGWSPSAYHLDVFADDADAGADFVVGVRVRHNFGGSAAKGGREALSSALWHTAPTHSANAQRNYVAVQGKTYSQQGDGGTNTGAGAQGAYFGGGFAAFAEALAINLLHITGAELNTFMHSDSSARYVNGLTIAGCNSVNGAEVDAGIAISGMSAVGIYGPHVGWDHGILFNDQSGAAPLHAGSTLIGAAWAAGGTKTIDKGIDLSAFVITNEIIKSQYAKWSTSTLTLGDAAGNAVVAVAGPSANANLILRSAGTGSFTLQDGSQRAVAQFTRFASGSAGTENYVDIVNNNSGAPATIAAASPAGTGDANVDLALNGKGTGLVRFGAHSGTGDVASNGHITIKDAAGNTRKLMTTA